MPDQPHGEIQTHHVKAEDDSHADRKPMTDGSQWSKQEPSWADPRPCWAACLGWPSGPCCTYSVAAGGAQTALWNREAANNTTSDYATWVVLLYLKVQREVLMWTSFLPDSKNYEESFLARKSSKRAKYGHLSMDGVCTVCCTWTLQRSVWCCTIHGSQHQKRSKIICTTLSLYG